MKARKNRSAGAAGGPLSRKTGGSPPPSRPLSAPAAPPTSPPAGSTSTSGEILDLRTPNSAGFAAYNRWREQLGAPPVGWDTYARGVKIYNLALLVQERGDTSLGEYLVAVPEVDEPPENDEN